MNPKTTLTLSVLPRAARAALQWRLLLLWALWMLIPTAILAAPLWQLFATNLDYSVHAGALAKQLDMTAFADLMAAHGKVSETFGWFGIIALVATLLISPLLSGMALTAARAEQTANFRALTTGGLREYPRMFRMLLWSAFPLGMALALGGVASEAAEKFGARAIVASDARLAFWAAIALTALLFAVAHATLDAGRAALAIERRRSSAVKAWLSGCATLVRRPFATVGIYLAITGAGLALAALLALARLNLPTASLGGFIAALVLTQVIVMSIAWMRSARLFAMVDLARTQRTSAY